MWNGNRKEAGDAGEAAALKQLQARGLKLVLRNHRCRMGEIDLVMLDGNTLALIEVRYRGDDSFGGATASVTIRKQRRLIAASRHLLATRSDLRRYRARFDVVALSPDADGKLQFDWIKGAFNADGS
ncbi:MAG: YraN family protein [Steroidobacteraceae bacterium]